MNVLYNYFNNNITCIKTYQPLVSEIIKESLSSPLQDLTSSCRKSIEELQKTLKGSDSLCRDSLKTLFGCGMMITQGSIPISEITRRIFNFNTYYSNQDIYLSCALFIVGWGACISDKVRARGIKNYKIKIEKAALDSKLTKEGTMLIINPSFDHNGGFDLSISDARNHERLSKRFKIVSATVSSNEEMLKAIHRVADEGHDIKLLEIKGHGCPYFINFGKPDPEIRFNYFRQGKLYGYEPGLEKALDRLNSKAIILLNSCSAAGASIPMPNPCPDWQTINVANRIAALANKRMVIGSPVPFFDLEIENDPESPLQGIKLHLSSRKKVDELYIQEHEQNTKEFEETRSFINVARAQSDIETAIFKLKNDKNYTIHTPVHLKIQAPEKIKKYLQFTLQGLLGNRLGVKNVEYVNAEPANGFSFQILEEPVQMEIVPL